VNKKNQRRINDIKNLPVPETFQSMFWNILFLTLIFFSCHFSAFIFSPCFCYQRRASDKYAQQINMLVGSFDFLSGPFFPLHIIQNKSQRVSDPSFCGGVPGALCLRFFSHRLQQYCPMFVLGICRIQPPS
jgi:hypothetical protein